MRAIYLERFGEEPSVRELSVPTPPAGGVVVRVLATGLCRSDWRAWAGHDSDVHLPHVPGHELAGVIQALGEGVTRWHVGDRVTVPFVEGCGQCEWCHSGNAQVCPDQTQPGFTHWGSFAQYVALRAADTNLIAIPDSVSFAAAASLGCRFATAYRALTGRAAVRPQKWVTVIGSGGVGLSAAMIAKALGARVIAVDHHRRALDLATAVGADHVILATDESVAAQVHELTGGGSHVAIDAVGSEQTCADSIMSLRRRGRHVQIGLLPPVGGAHPRVPMARAIAWELDLLGSHGMASVDYPAMLAMIERRELEPQRLIERTVGLAQAAELLPAVDSSSPAGMTMIDPWLA